MGSHMFSNSKHEKMIKKSAKLKLAKELMVKNKGSGKPGFTRDMIK